MTLDVFATHVDHAFQAITRANGRGGNTVLTGPGLSDHARFTHAFREHGLTDRIVDLVRAGVVQVFAFEVDLRAPLLTAHACCVVNRGGATDEVLELVLKFSKKGGVMLVLCVRLFELVDGMR